MEFKAVMAIILVGLYIFIILAAEITIWRLIIDYPIEETTLLFFHETETQEPPSMCKDEGIRNPAPPSFEDIMKLI